jgi:hypothetical protein
MKNVAYSSEYLEHRKRFDYIFSDKYKCNEDEIRQLKYNNLFLKTSYYSDHSHEKLEYNVNTSKTDIFNGNGNKVAEIRNIDYSVDLFSEIEHSNGKYYLIFSTDLYGYSLLDLSNYQIYNYVPEESLIQGNETFIWTDTLYCKKNNIIAVDGCFWACPFSTYFYDFSEPEILPYELICNSYDMDEEINIETDVTPLRWNEDGTIVIKCCDGKDGENETEKTVDIASRRIKS